MTRNFSVRRQHDDERGWTLVELLVVMIILGSVLSGVYAAMSNLQTTAVGASERLQNLDEARVLMATITKDIRTAARPATTESPFLKAEPREIEFYAHLNSTDPHPKKVRIWVDSNLKLVEETVAYPYTALPTVRIVGRWVANTDSDPIFKFFDSTGTELIGAPGLDDDQRKQVEALEVTLMIRKSPRIGIPTTLVNRVRLPNVDFNPLPTT